jgi:hypothetical protein
VLEEEDEEEDIAVAMTSKYHARIMMINSRIRGNQSFLHYVMMIE